MKPEKKTKGIINLKTITEDGEHPIAVSGPHTIKIDTEGRIEDIRAITLPDYGQEMYLRFVEDALNRLTDKEWERVKKRRDDSTRSD